MCTIAILIYRPTPPLFYPRHHGTPSGQIGFLGLDRVQP
jgi:hypothetical protein